VSLLVFDAASGGTVLLSPSTSVYPWFVRAPFAQRADGYGFGRQNRRTIEKQKGRKLTTEAHPAVETHDEIYDDESISLGEYRAGQATAYLLSNRAYAAHLRQSIAETRFAWIGERTRLAA
jgi:hypothetical protein